MTLPEPIALLPRLAQTAKNVAECEVVATHRNVEGGRVYRFAREADCAFCAQPVDWKRTCFADVRLPFDTPVPRSMDPAGDGWVPGPWRVRGRIRTVLAPLRRYDAAKRLRVGHVVFPHRCIQFLVWSARSRADAVA